MYTYLIIYFCLHIVTYVFTSFGIYYYQGVIRMASPPRRLGIGNKVPPKGGRFSRTRVYTGQYFYEKYKDAAFLKDKANIVTILCQGYKFRHGLRTLLPGESLKIDGMFLYENSCCPLSIKKTGFNDNVHCDDFTFNRLSGLVAAYVYEHRSQFPVLTASDPKALGLVWNNANSLKSALYLSAVSGSEHFVDQFRFYPLICALQKYQQNRLPEELLVKIAKIRYRGERHNMAMVMNEAPTHILNQLWNEFPGNLHAFPEFLSKRTPLSFKMLLREINPQNTELNCVQGVTHVPNIVNHAPNIFNDKSIVIDKYWLRKLIEPYIFSLLGVAVNVIGSLLLSHESWLKCLITPYIFSILSVAVDFIRNIILRRESWLKRLITGLIISLLGGPVDFILRHFNARLQLHEFDS